MKSKTISNINDFDSVFLKLASPDDIKEWSFGEVTKPETINYRTQRSEKNGLFDERIFGPDRDYECYCGKYRGVRYKAIVCEKCGVELTRSIVRRERMGHIELATPVSHIWFLRSMPSRLGLLLGMTSADLEKVIYFAGYLITGVDSGERARLLRELEAEYRAKVKTLTKERERDAFKERYIGAKREIEDIVKGAVLDEVAYHAFSLKYGTLFDASIGAEAIFELLTALDLPVVAKTLEAELLKAGSAERERINKRCSLVRSMMSAKIRPEWMFLKTIPVIPPALRPMVPLDGGRYATSDVNDLYRRVINRNNRLRKLKEINAPDVILRNEKRILQEAVYSLIDNPIRHGIGSAGALTASQRRPLKSLADNLKGKRGLFRQNLLGKRVDYSGRSVIVVGPDLKLHQCGLPKHMALELFRPFVINKLITVGFAHNIRSANRLIDDATPDVWAILEEVINGKYVLLNRAPTLHRLGIQAFQPVLIEGNAIQIHPMVCSAFNADFDGDQMAVHVPLTEEAQKEAGEIMAATKNLLKPGTGDPTSTPSQDMVIGCYWLTKLRAGGKGEGKIFSNPNEAILAYDHGILDLKANVKVRATESPKYKKFEGGIFETSVGRLLFNSVLPDDFEFMNEEIKKKTLEKIVARLIVEYGGEKIPPILDKIKSFGYRYATMSGISWGMDDLKVPPEKGEIIRLAEEEAMKVENQYNDGLLTDDERYDKIISIWAEVKRKVDELVPKLLSSEGPVHLMVSSAARGTWTQVTQMTGMKGLVRNPA